MKATLYVNGVIAQRATDALDIRSMINRFFIRARRGENVRLEVNGE